MSAPRSAFAFDLKAMKGTAPQSSFTMSVLETKGSPQNVGPICGQNSQHMTVRLATSGKEQQTSDSVWLQLWKKAKGAHRADFFRKHQKLDGRQS
jgi:hypothetical protein